jgi:hypothetical protein
MQSCLCKHNCHLPFSIFFLILHNFHSPANNHAFPFLSTLRHFSFHDRPTVLTNTVQHLCHRVLAFYNLFILPFYLFLSNYTPVDATTKMLFQYSPSPLSAPKPIFSHSCCLAAIRNTALPVPQYLHI